MTLKPVMWFGGALALMIVLAIVSCIVGWSTYDGKYSGLPECPHAWAEYVQAPKAHNVSLSPYAPAFESQDMISYPITDIPEYHDCQKLIMRDGTYGPLVAVFTNAKFDSIGRVLDSLSEARITVGRPPSAGDTARPAVRAVVIAQLFNQEAAQYAPLGIQAGFSCLYLYFETGRAKAKLVNTGASAKCDAADPLIVPGMVLGVQRGVVPGFVNAGAYPGAVRWDWDAAARYQYISVKCGRITWCDIGVEPLTPSGPAGVFASASPEGQVRSIKGWYDEQQLDVVTASGELAPTNVFGTVIPHPELKNRSLADYENKWQVTGFVAMSANLPLYNEKFAFEAVPTDADTKRLNTIEFCHGTRSACDIPFGAALPNNTCGPLNWFCATFRARWWARFQGSSQRGTTNYKYKCVIRRTHPDPTNTKMASTEMGVPGTARWRWLATDPTVWEECANGCCEVEESGS